METEVLSRAMRRAMAKQDKKPGRPVRKAKPVSVAGGLLAISRAQDEAEQQKPLTDEQVTDLAVVFRLAFQQMLSGGANEQNWCACVCSLNIGMVLSEWGLGPDYKRNFVDALDGAFRAKLRAGRTGKWGFDGDAIQAIKFAFEVHEEQIKAAPKGMIRDALHEVHRRDKEGNVYKEAA